MSIQLHVNIQAYSPTNTHNFTYIYTHLCVHISWFILVFNYVYMHVLLHKITCIYTCIYKYIYMYMYLCIYLSAVMYNYNYIILFTYACTSMYTYMAPHCPQERRSQMRVAWEASALDRDCCEALFEASWTLPKGLQLPVGGGMAMEDELKMRCN